VAASLTGHQDAGGATGDQARHTFERTDQTAFIRRSIAAAQAWRQGMAKGLVTKPTFKVLNEPESMKSVDPPLVLTEVWSEVLHSPGTSRKIW
jgi:hypothetical protein